MADFTLSSGHICEPHRSPWGGFPMRTMQVSTGVSSAAIPIGRKVTLDWSSTQAGQVKGSTAEGWFFGVGIAGSAVSGSTGARGTDITVYEAHPSVEFKAVTKGANLDLAQVGLSKKLMYDSTLQIEYVDLTASTAADWRVVVTGLLDAVGDSGGYVSFRFLSQLGGGNIGSSVAITSTSPVLAFYR